MQHIQFLLSPFVWSFFVLGLGIIILFLLVKDRRLKKHKIRAEAVVRRVQEATVHDTRLRSYNCRKFNFSLFVVSVAPSKDMVRSSIRVRNRAEFEATEENVHPELVLSRDPMFFEPCKSRRDVRHIIWLDVCIHAGIQSNIVWIRIGKGADSSHQKFAEYISQSFVHAKGWTPVLSMGNDQPCLMYDLASFAA